MDTQISLAPSTPTPEDLQIIEPAEKAPDAAMTPASEMDATLDGAQEAAHEIPSNPPGTAPAPDETTPDGTTPSPKQTELTAVPKQSTLTGDNADAEDAEADLEPWEEALLAAAEGRGVLPEFDEIFNMIEAPAQEPASSSPLSSPPPTPPQEDTPKAKAKKATGTPRTVSVKYSPTERYWLNRMYRAYRVQQAAIKAAKANGDKPPKFEGGLLTHPNLMEAFNERFAGKYVDGIPVPRPSREKHSFGLWSNKNCADGDAHMKGTIPDFWQDLEKKMKPEGISLEEELDVDWNTDEYLAIKSEPPTPDAPVPQQSSKKRKAAALEHDGPGPSKKTKLANLKNSNKAFSLDEKLKQFNRTFAQAWGISLHRRNSAPSLSRLLEPNRVREVHGDFFYEQPPEQLRQLRLPPK